MIIHCLKIPTYIEIICIKDRVVYWVVDVELRSLWPELMKLSSSLLLAATHPLKETTEVSSQKKLRKNKFNTQCVYAL